MKLGPRGAAVIVGAAILLGGALRVDQVSSRSISHPEMYVPGIPLRIDLSIPKPRMDLQTVVTNTLSAEPHPPGYYILMWAVTKCFGAGTLALRLPSVLFGAATIGLLFWLGLLIGQPAAGTVAALLLAFNGYHILWSKTARMYSMMCFLGVLTAVLLLLIARSTRPRRSLEAAYALLLLTGLATQHYFWTLLAVQMLWVLAQAWDRKLPMPRIFKVQWLVVILGSPLLALAVYQSANDFGSPPRDVLPIARDYIQFMYLIPGFDDTIRADGLPGLALSGQFLVPRILLFLFCAALFIAGLRRLRTSNDAGSSKLIAETGKSFPWLCWLAAVPGVLGILALIVIAQHHGNAVPTLKYTKVLTVLPLLLALAATFFEKWWDRLRPPVNLGFLSGNGPLVWLLAVAPFVLLASVSLIRPIIFPRSLVYLTPYVLLTLACGIVAIGQSSRWLAGGLVLVLGFLHGVSVAGDRDKMITPVDFGEFAGKLQSRMQPNDLIFMERRWDVTPILYYLQPSRYHISADHFEDAIRQNPDARVWVLFVRMPNYPPGAQEALQGYGEGETVGVYLAHAVLYCRNGCSAAQ